MKHQLEYYIKSALSNPKEEDILSILEIFHLKEFQKDEYFKNHDKICRNLGFIVKGSCRHYIIKSNGDEITGRISKINDFVSDIISVRNKRKTPIFVKAIEPTTMLVASMKNVEILLEINLTFNRLIREYMADALVEMGEMRILFLTGTAKDRYGLILENNPNLLNNIPLRFIATMIGVTPTQLSRIRKKR